MGRKAHAPPISEQTQRKNWVVEVLAPVTVGATTTLPPSALEVQNVGLLSRKQGLEPTPTDTRSCRFTLPTKWIDPVMGEKGTNFSFISTHS